MANGDADIGWANLTVQDLESDLRECEDSRNFSAKDFRQADQLSASLINDVEALFAAQRTLHDSAFELQAALAQVEMLQIDSAALVANLEHGPLRAPGTERLVDVGVTAVEAFGSAAGPVMPPSVLDGLAALGSAETVVEYERRLATFPPSLFIGRTLRLCVAEVDQYQDAKDIGRDTVVVNGHCISGARGGYRAAVDELVAGLRATGTWTCEAAERAAQLILGALNRTSSGGTAFEQVFKIFDCPDVVFIAPESAAARPLEAILLDGVVLGRAHTRYGLHTVGGEGSAMAVVDANFTFRLSIDTLHSLAEVRRVEGDNARWPADEIRAAILLSHSQK